MWLSWQSTLGSYLARMQLWVPCPGSHKVDVVVHTFAPSTCEMETQDQRKVTLTSSSNVRSPGYPQYCLKNKQKPPPPNQLYVFPPQNKKGHWS